MLFERSQGQLEAGGGGIWGYLMAQLLTILGLQVLLGNTLSLPHTSYPPRAG